MVMYTQCRLNWFYFVGHIQVTLELLLSQNIKLIKWKITGKSIIEGLGYHSAYERVMVKCFSWFYIVGYQHDIKI